MSLHLLICKVVENLIESTIQVIIARVVAAFVWEDVSVGNVYRACSSLCIEALQVRKSGEWLERHSTQHVGLLNWVLLFSKRSRVQYTW
jgi:hypothetical protein